MAAQNLAAKLQKRIILYSALGILATGVIVGLAGLMPLVVQLRDAQTRGLQIDLRAQTKKVEEFIAAARLSATLRGSGVQIREQFAQYAAGNMDLARLQQFCDEWITERLSFSSNTVGLVLLDPSGLTTASGGEKIPAEYHRFSPDADVEPTLTGPLFLSSRPMLIVSAPIVSESDRIVGGVVILRRMTQLQRLVTDYTGFGKSGETIVGDIYNPERPIFFGFRPRRHSVIR